MTLRQQEEIQRWTYLVKGIDHRHALNWYRQLLDEKSKEEAELFKKRVNYINGMAL